MSDDRPHELPSTTQRIDTGWGRVYVTITVCEEGNPFEVFVTTGPSGGMSNAQSEAIGKLISTALRMAEDRGEAARELADSLEGIRSDRVDEDNGDTVLSIPDAVGVAIRRQVEGRLGESVRDVPPGPETKPSKPGGGG